MDAESLKGKLINGYLNQQLSLIGTDDNDNNTTTMTGGAVQQLELPDNAVLEEFKNQVRLWLEVDNQIQKIQQAVRERNVLKKNLSEKILRFMAKYNIEDLHAKDCTLRYKLTTVKSTPSKAEIKQLMEENYNKAESMEKLMEICFAKQERKVASLRRFKSNK